MLQHYYGSDKKCSSNAIKVNESKSNKNKVNESKIDDDEDNKKILEYTKKANIFCGNIGLLNNNPAAQKQIILYQDVVRGLYKSQNIDVLNNLKVTDMNKIYDLMRIKTIDDPVSYMIASLINNFYEKGDNDEK